MPIAIPSMKASAISWTLLVRRILKTARRRRRSASARRARFEEEILAVGPENVAAFAGEPVQGAGGVKIAPETYWPEIQRIVDKYGILLLADEVITGFGRLGTWFASEYYGIRPNLITFAKAATSGYIPLSGVIVDDKIVEALMAENDDFNHGYTFSGHPVACAVALKNLEIMERERLVPRVKETDRAGAGQDARALQRSSACRRGALRRPAGRHRARRRQADAQALRRSWAASDSSAAITSSAKASSCAPCSTRWCARRR